jgi:cell division protease FtsH
MGGRIAEELVFGDPSTGASNDISQATEIARQMVTEFGMSTKIGSVRLSGSSGEVFLGRDMGHGREYSENVASVVDQEVRGLMDNALAEATTALSQNRHILDALALELLDKETLGEIELAEIFKDVVKITPRGDWLSGEWVANAPAAAKAPALIREPDGAVEEVSEVQQAEEDSAPVEQAVEPKDEA